MDNEQPMDNEQRISFIPVELYAGKPIDQLALLDPISKRWWSVYK